MVTKKIILSITLSLFLIFTTTNIFAEIPPSIFTAIESSNTGELTKYLNSSVELSILDKDDVYSKQQASVILKDFFTKNKVKSFSIVHQGGKDGAQYAICKMGFVNGINYRIYFLVKDNLIHQFRITEE